MTTRKTLTEESGVAKRTRLSNDASTAASLGKSVLEPLHIYLQSISGGEFPTIELAGDNPTVAHLETAVRKSVAPGLFTLLHGSTALLDEAMMLADYGIVDGVTLTLIAKRTFRVATTSYDGTIKIWDGATGLCKYTMYYSDVMLLKLSPDDSLMLTASLGCTLVIWDTATGKVKEELGSHMDEITSATFAANATLVLSASVDQTAKIWDIATRNAITMFHTSAVNSAMFSADETLIFTGSSDKTARIWDSASGACKMTIHHTMDVACALPAPNNCIITCSCDKTAKISDIATGKCQTMLRGHSSTVAAAVFSTDGSLALTTALRDAKVWDLATGECKQTFPGRLVYFFEGIIWGRNQHAVFSADGLSVLVVNTLCPQIWDIATGECKLTLEGHVHSLRGHPMLTCSAMFSCDGSLILTSSEDKTAKIWDSATGRCMLTLRGHSDVVHVATFFSDNVRMGT